MYGRHAATSKVENSAQGSSCQLKFVHDSVKVLFIKESFAYIQFHFLSVTQKSRQQVGANATKLTCKCKE